MVAQTQEIEQKSVLTSQQKNLLDRVKNKAHLIGHLVGFRDLTELHATWINKFWKARRQVYVLQSHRGSYKTSCIALFISLILLCRPHENVFYIRKTETLVKDIVAKVSKIMQSNVFQGLASIMYGQNYRLIKNTATEIDTSLPHGDSKEVQFIGFGLDGKMTGRHCDWLIGDDLCFVSGTKIATPFGDKNIEDIKVGDRVLTTNGYQEVIKISQRQAEVICNVGLCGTPNHPVFSKIDNCYKDLKDIKENEIIKLNDKQYVCQNLTGIQTVYNIEVANTHNYYANGILVHNCNIKDRTSRAERERIKLVWQELQNVRNRGGRTIAVGTNWHIQDVFSLMPPADVYTCYDCCDYGIMTKKEIENLKKTMTPALFAANYELKFIANEDAIFTDIRYLKPSDMTEQEIKDGVKPKDLLDGCIAHLDASYGGGDTTALTLMKKLPDNRIIAFGKVWEKHVKHCMNEITMLCNLYNYRSLWMETNGDKGYLAQEFRQRGMRVMTYHEKMNKDVKIQTYLYGAWQDIYWLEETDANYVNQVMDYTENAEIVDAPDSGACACRLLNKGKVKALSGFDYI